MRLSAMEKAPADPSNGRLRSQGRCRTGRQPRWLADRISALLNREVFPKSTRSCDTLRRGCARRSIPKRIPHSRLSKTDAFSTVTLPEPGAASRGDVFDVLRRPSKGPGIAPQGRGVSPVRSRRHGDLLSHAIAHEDYPLRSRTSPRPIWHNETAGPPMLSGLASRGNRSDDQFGAERSRSRGVL